MITAKSADIPLQSAEKLIKLPNGFRRSELCELRLRSGRPAVAVTADGRLIPCSETLTKQDIEDCFGELCRHSIHSFSREIAEGYITLPNGHRAGFCGTAVMSGEKLQTLRDISSINLRFAREIKGCAEALHHIVFRNRLCSLLIAGKPLSGKTTVLRDLARLLAEKHRVALIDSRNELAACFGGVPQLDVGVNTDVLSGYPKREGMEIALRTLSPEIIICDEIGSEYDAVIQCAHCGVKVIATIHAASIEELSLNQNTKQLLEAFDCTVVLSEKGSIKELKGAQI